VLSLRACIAPVVPETLSVWRHERAPAPGVTAFEPGRRIAAEEWARPGLFELRVYAAGNPAQAGLLEACFVRTWRRAGIGPLLHRNGGAALTYLLPFDSLEARDKAWNAFTADPDWVETRREFASLSSGAVPTYRFAIYRPTRVLAA
jgi:hypothetical protein